MDLSLLWEELRVFSIIGHVSKEMLYLKEYTWVSGNLETLFEIFIVLFFPTFHSFYATKEDRKVTPDTSDERRRKIEGTYAR